ncbi:MAG: hypothetical protein K0R29_1548 [Pseudobdellovibrio sp.]|jgi:hypothetical protein|nr:hypothetical protein [Pseudobdellovibrio sp.]
MKFFTLLCLLLVFDVQAATRVKFMPMNMNVMINVTEKDIYGNSDSDSADLYAIMNVSEQDSMLGKGKSIVTSDKDFNLVCSKEKKMCSIILKKSARTEISPERKYTAIRIVGEEAKVITEKFKLNDRGEAYFQASDKLFRIFGTRDSFIFEASGE